VNGLLELYAAVLDNVPEEFREPLARMAVLEAEQKEAAARELAQLKERVAALERQLRPPSRVEAALAGGRKA
jgi:Tfp pilus assembly protein PilO